MNRLLSYVLTVVCCFGLCLSCYSGTLEEQRKSATAQLKASLKSALVSANAAELSAAIDAYVEGKINDISNAIDKHVKGDDAKASLKNAVEQIRNGNISKIDVGKVAQDVAVGALKDSVSRHLGGKEAEAVNNAIDAYMKDRVAGVKESAQKTVNGIIDKYVKGDDAKASLKNAVEQIKNGDISKVDVGKIASDVAVGGINDWIDRTNWSEKDKQAAKGAIGAFFADGIDGLTETGVKIIKSRIADKIGGKNTEQLFGAVENIIGSGKLTWDNIKTIGESLDTIIRTELVNKIDKQLNRLAEKYPIIGEFFKFANINGENIVAGLAKVWGILFSAGSIADKLTELAKLTMTALNELVKNLTEFVKQFIEKKIADIFNQISEKAKQAIEKIREWLKSAADKIKDIVARIKDFIGKLKNTLAEIKQMGKYVLEKAEDIKVNVQESVKKAKEKVRHVFESQLPVSPAAN